MGLILNETPLGRFGHGGKGRPGVAVTYSTATGQIRMAGDVLVGLRCKVRYEIDMSDQRDETLLALPSRDERQFNTRIGVGWRVFDPYQVTSRRIDDGFPVITGYLQPVVRRLSRVLAVEQPHDLEDQINQLLAAGPARFPEGLEVFHVDAQVSSDEHTVTHAATLRQADRSQTVAEMQHMAELTAAKSQIDLDSLRRRAIEEMVGGEHGLLLHHLTVHRDDTMGVLHMLQQQDATSTEARARLLEQFKDRLLPEELDGLAELLIRHTKDSIERPGTPALMQPQVPPAIVPGTTVPPPAIGAAAAAAALAPEPLRTTVGTNGAAPSDENNGAERHPVRTDSGGHE
jgi:hypothetical protein